MPRILAASLAEHNDQAWNALTRALERLLASTSYEDITMARVASAAGMARNTLYNYADDKPSLVAAATERASAGLLSKITAISEGSEQPGARIETIVAAIVAWFVDDDHRHVVATGLFVHPSSSMMDQTTAPLLRIESRISRLIDEGIASGDLRCLPDRELTLRLVSAVAEWAVRHVVRKPDDLAVVTGETLRVVRASLYPDRH